MTPDSDPLANGMGKIIQKFRQISANLPLDQYRGNDEIQIMGLDSFCQALTKK